MTLLNHTKEFLCFPPQDSKIIDAEQGAAAAYAFQVSYYKHISFLCLFGAIYLAILLLLISLFKVALRRVLKCRLILLNARRLWCAL